MSLYQELKAAGVPLDNHESDLYAQMTPESTRIIRTYRADRMPGVFRSAIDGLLWFDIPFAYEPFWERRSRLRARNPLAIAGRRDRLPDNGRASRTVR